jgi:hypothetical protein
MRAARCGWRLRRYAHFVAAVAMLTADRVFDVFGDHSYRMDLRG